ncbi:hypothetical protein D3C71_1937050 [compost metagenome]
MAVSKYFLVLVLVLVLAVMPLGRRDEADSPMAIYGVVPGHKIPAPNTRFVQPYKPIHAIAGSTSAS